MLTFLANVRSNYAPGVLEDALKNVIDAEFISDILEDRSENSAAVEVLCLVTGRCLDFEPYGMIFEALEDNFGTAPLVEGLPFGLPTSKTWVPLVWHGTPEYLSEHLEHLDRNLDAGAFAGEEGLLVRKYRDIIQKVVEANLGIIRVSW